ncbi:hypothetical protein BDQ12DRAFT_692072 [Crucibulum laeve]|uniref:Uncharacterized protein n=1 Tax=Crucibulum laeve TaxID=68775 RepID=A0A5C3LJ00_9AGAR|nr:hypothetical protein BDQ12DRAFT_692072 [Crucibulum laeve]
MRSGLMMVNANLVAYEPPTQAAASVIASEIMFSLDHIKLDVEFAIVTFAFCMTLLLLPFVVSGPETIIDVLFVLILNILDL